jgi:three-Cys-motif partner protein
MEKKGKGRKPVSFGGHWTDTKLDVLAKYLRAYTTALKKQRFQKIYIDAFAGTGYRDPIRVDEGGQGVLLEELAGTEPQELRQGSVTLALQVTPRFDKYVFIEKSRARCTELAALRKTFPSLAADIEIVEGDANEIIRRMCEEDWSARRAVLFLDPFGMQVEWRTVQAIARTEAIDLWYLFPIGMGVIRLLDLTGDIPEAWRRRLDSVLPPGWFDRLYKRAQEPTLFEIEVRPERATPAEIADYLVESLKATFAGVAATPAVLKNSTNFPLYLFCFAASNKNGARIAVKIANDLLGGLA